MSTPYQPTWTLDAKLDRHVRPHLESSALLIIDMQVDFADGGVATIPGTTGVVGGVARLRRAFLDTGLMVVHVIRIYHGGDVDLVRRSAVASGWDAVAAGSPGSAILPQLLEPSRAMPEARRLLSGDIVPVGPSEVVMWKPRWSAFYRTALDDYLRGRPVDTVVIAGCNFPNCPRATLIDASQRDYRLLLAADAVSQLREHHLAELALVGALHADTATIAAAVTQ